MGYAHEVVKDRLGGMADLSVTRIGAEEVLYRLHRGERIAFVDARREPEWRQAEEKLPGAVRLAPERADDTLPLIPPGRTIVAYCTCPAEASSIGAAELLKASGYGDVYVLFGGLRAWRVAGGPLEQV
jgi:rhodanese-related sulfurtransferase